MGLDWGGVRGPPPGYAPGFTFLVPAHLGSPAQRAVKRVCVCILLYYWANKIMMMMMMMISNGADLAAVSAGTCRSVVVVVGVAQLAVSAQRHVSPEHLAAVAALVAAAAVVRRRAVRRRVRRRPHSHRHRQQSTAPSSEHFTRTCSAPPRSDQITRDRACVAYCTERRLQTIGRTCAIHSVHTYTHTRLTALCPGLPG